MFIGVSPAAQPALGHIAAFQARRAYADAMPFIGLSGIGRPQPSPVDSYVSDGSGRDGETIVAGWNCDGASVSLYRPAGSSEDRPTYRARSWEAGTSRPTVRDFDASRIDPSRADELEMFVLTTHMARSGQESAARTFIKVRDAARDEGADTSQRADWLDRISDTMIAKYAAGEVDEFVAIKELWDELSDRAKA